MSTSPINSLAITSVVTTNANTEYVLTAPKGTKFLEIFTNHASAVIRIAFETGKVAGPTEPYINLPNGKQWWIDDLMLTRDTTIYIATDTNGAVVNMSYGS